MQLHAPALQTQLTAAEFEIVVEDEPIGDLRIACSRFSARRRSCAIGAAKSYNLRPLVQAISIEPLSLIGS